jgi:hypothetical protein
MATSIFLEDVIETITSQLKTIIEAEMVGTGILTVADGLNEEIQFYSTNTYRRNKKQYPVILTYFGPIQNISTTQYCQEEHELEVGFYVYVKESEPDIGVAEASKIASRLRRLFRRQENLRLGVTDGSVTLVRSGTFLRDVPSSLLEQNNVFSSYVSVMVKFRTIEL